MSTMRFAILRERLSVLTEQSEDIRLFSAQLEARRRDADNRIGLSVINKRLAGSRRALGVAALP
jgi:hypothetical protein